MIFTGKFDQDGLPIFFGDKIAAVWFNGTAYNTLLEVVVDPEDGEFCLKMIAGNEKAMSVKGPLAFPSEHNGKLRTGRII